MEEENKVIAPEEAVEPSEEKETGIEPHGSVSAPRPGDRKNGSHTGRPSERRGGRGGFRRGHFLRDLLRAARSRAGKRDLRRLCADRHPDLPLRRDRRTQA